MRGGRKEGYSNRKAPNKQILTLNQINNASAMMMMQKTNNGSITSKATQRIDMGQINALGSTKSIIVKNRQLSIHESLGSADSNTYSKKGHSGINLVPIN